MWKKAKLQTCEYIHQHYPYGNLPRDFPHKTIKQWQSEVGSRLEGAPRAANITCPSFLKIILLNQQLVLPREQRPSLPTVGGVYTEGREPTRRAGRGIVSSQTIAPPRLPVFLFYPHKLLLIASYWVKLNSVINFRNTSTSSQTWEKTSWEKEAGGMSTSSLRT